MSSRVRCAAVAMLFGGCALPPATKVDASGGAVDKCAHPAADAGVDTSCGADLSNDPRNCGACFHDCLAGGCAEGSCEPAKLAHAQYPTGIVPRAGLLYWGDNYTREVSKLDLDGGATPSALATEMGSLSVPVADAEAIYFVMTSGCPSAHQCIVRVKYDGTVTTPVNRDDIRGIATNGTSLVWGEVTDGGSVWRVSPQGGQPTELATNESGASVLAIDDQYAYWRYDSAQPSSIVRCDLSGAGAPEVFTKVRGNGPMALDAWNSYVASAGSDAGDIVSFPRSGGLDAEPTVLAQSQYDVSSLAVDDLAVYWGSSTSGPRTTSRCGGGVVRELYSGPVSVTGIAVDAVRVYWSFLFIGGGSPAGIFALTK